MEYFFNLIMVLSRFLFRFFCTSWVISFVLDDKPPKGIVCYFVGLLKQILDEIGASSRGTLMVCLWVK